MVAHASVVSVTPRTGVECSYVEGSEGRLGNTLRPQLSGLLAFNRTLYLQSHITEKWEDWKQSFPLGHQLHIRLALEYD